MFKDDKGGFEHYITKLLRKKPKGKLVLHKSPRTNIR